MEQRIDTLKSLSDLTVQRMQELGYSEGTLRSYRNQYQSLILFSEPLGEKTVFSEHLMNSYLEHYCQRHPEDTANGRKRCREAQRFLTMMRDCSVHGGILRHKMRKTAVPEPFQADLSAFQTFMAEKGLSQGSRKRIGRVAEQVTFFLFQRTVRDFQTVTDEDLLSFAKTLLGYSKKTAAVSMYALRVLVFYLNSSGRNPFVTKENIPSNRYVNRRSLPKVWTSEECQRLLNAVERNAPIGKRDYAILMLAINLGMRTSDILSLKFENIDWKNGQIHFVQKKTGTANTLGIDKAVGWAVIDYLKNGRPDREQDSHVFLTHKVPFRPMRAFDSSLQKYLERAGIHSSPGQMHGMHSLRHPYVKAATKILKEQVESFTPVL